MPNAREQILGRIRAALGRTRLSTADRQTLAQRVNSPPVTIQPRWKEPDKTRFTRKLSEAAATVGSIADINELPVLVSRYLEKYRLEHRLLITDDPMVASLPWGDIRIHTGPNDGHYPVCLTLAYAGIAETGTIVVCSSPQSPTTHNFLPEHHIILLPAERLVKHIEDLWQKLRAEEKGLARTINLITGPSRTADIEQTIQLGAHGPRFLHIVLLLRA